MIVNFNYQKTPKSIGGFEIDCVISEHYSFSNSVTDIPVEDGSTINDHVVSEAPEISIQAFIGKTEFTVWEGAMPETQSDIEVTDPKARIRAAYLELNRLKEERQPLDLVLGLDTFPNMIISKFEIGRDAATGADLQFSMTFKQIRIVKSETTIVNSSMPSADQTAGTANMGVAGTKIVDPDSDRMQQNWKQMGQSSGWSYPTWEEYLEKCRQAGWTP